MSPSLLWLATCISFQHVRHWKNALEQPLWTPCLPVGAFANIHMRVQEKQHLRDLLHYLENSNGHRRAHRAMKAEATGVSASL